MNPARWTVDEVKAFLRDEDLKYQRIELPYGLATAGADRTLFYDKVFPQDLVGKSVLDVGCNIGGFCFEAARRGARRVVGIDVDPRNIRCAERLAHCLGYDIEFRLGDVERDSCDEQFDFVLCLNVLHHLKNPIAAIGKLQEFTRERLVLEVATLGSHDRRKLGISWFRGLFLRRTPAIVVTGARRDQLAGGQRFFFSQRAIENMLQSHGIRFAGITSFASDHKDRFVTVAHKRHIKRLLVIAGPTSVGKSTIIQRLRRDELPELARLLNLGDPASWTVTNANRLHELTGARIEKLLLHYDILRPLRMSAKTYTRDSALEVVDAAREVSIVTLWEPPHVLLQRLEESEILPKTRNGRFQGNRRYLQIREKYRDTAKVAELYRPWISYCQSLHAAHRVLSFSDGMRTIDDTASFAARNS